MRSISESGVLARKDKVDPKSKRLKVDKSGEVAGEWKIVSQAGWESLSNGRHQPTWNVVCSCGNTQVMKGAT